MDNPFIYRAYQSKELFCDRQKELQKLIKNALSGADTTLIAQRRIGKTGLIYRLFEEIKTEGIPLTPIYIDIFATRSLEDLVKVLSEAILSEFPEQTSIGKRFSQFIRSLRPMISYDPLTSAPQLQLTMQTQQEKEQTLGQLLTFLDTQDTHVLLAIDEFQQIRNYPENNVEALLRTHIQRLNNVTFLFCGSKRHLMLDIFSSERNPFYRSTEFLALDKISADAYAEFIQQKFRQADIDIDTEAVSYILDWTRRHTYFTQRLCHTVFNMAEKSVDVDFVKQAAAGILQSDTIVFNQYQQILTAGQWDFLIAVAKEGEARQITSQKFLQKYKLGNASSVNRMVKSLIEKDLLNEDTENGKPVYSLNDVFLSRWLASKY
ncbi:MAG: ATP-binding protein [Bacteroidales bacterium]|nr:ATP-binding protein [Bacteroidales bacterium]